jgi:hypothetical protein
MISIARVKRTKVAISAFLALAARAMLPLRVLAIETTAE